MRTLDSRGTLIADGQRLCIICERRPQRRTPAGKWLSYCRECAAETERQRRAGRLWLLVTPHEAELIKASRVQPAGRHHANEN